MTADDESESPRAAASWHHFGQKVVGDPSVYIQLGSGTADMTRSHQGDLRQPLHHMWLAPAAKLMEEMGTASYINEVVLNQPHFAPGPVVITINYDLALEKARRLFFTRRGESKGISAFDVTRLSNAVFVPPATANQVIYERHLNPADPAGFDALQIAFLKPISIQAVADSGQVQPIRVFRPHGVSAVVAPNRLAGVGREFLDISLISEEYEYEHGMDDPYAIALRAFLERNGDEAVRVIEHLRTMEKLRPELLARTIRTVARWGASSKSDGYMRLLLACLTDVSPRVRHAAASSLGAVGKRDIIPRLRDALAKETHSAVKKSLEAALADIAA